MGDRELRLRDSEKGIGLWQASTTQSQDFNPGLLMLNPASLPLCVPDSVRGRLVTGLGKSALVGREFLQISVIARPWTAPFSWSLFWSGEAAQVTVCLVRVLLTVLLFSVAAGHYQLAGDSSP